MVRLNGIVTAKTTVQNQAPPLETMKLVGTKTRR